MTDLTHPAADAASTPATVANPAADAARTAPPAATPAARPAPRRERPTVLVLSATGKTGRRVATRLAAQGVPVRAGSRAGDPPFDWEDRTTWEAALQGVGAAYVSYYPDLALPQAAETVGAFAEQAVALGVRRLVLLSGRGEEGAQAAERAVARSGAEWTVVRCSWFQQNFSESFLLDPLLEGDVALPVDGVREPFLDAEDVADVAVAALTQDGHGGRAYELTGPRLLTFAEAIGEIARASGRALRFHPIGIEDFAAGLEAAQVPPDMIVLLRHLFTEVLDGRNASLADGVQQALGRPPRDFADYARATAVSGAWDA